MQDPLGSGADGRVRHGTGDEVLPRQCAEVGQQRVGAVEQPQLEQLVAGDVVGEHRARDTATGRLPGRAARGEPVLQRPHAERLGGDRDGVVDTGEAGGGGPGGVRGRGDDPVHHAVREGHPGQIGGELLALGLGHGVGEPVHQPGGGVAVAEQVVAAQHGDGSRAGAGPVQQPTGDQADRGARSGVTAQVGADTGVVEVEPAGDRVERVAVLGHRERDDPGAGGGQRGQHRVRLPGGDPHPGVHGRDDGALPRRGDLDDGVAQVLGDHGVGDGGAARRHAQDPPGPVGRVERGGGVHGLVGAVEVGQSEVDDSGVLPGRHGPHQSVIEPSRRRATGSRAGS
nr:hypothetical protein [Pseudonocardia sp. ICBG1142]